MAIKNSDHKFIWGNWQSLLTVEMNLEGLIRFRNIPFNDTEKVIEIAKDNRTSCYHSMADLKRDDRNGRRIFFNDKSSSSFIKDTERAIADHWKLYGEIRETDFSKLDNKEILECFRKMFDDWCRIIGYFRASQESTTQYLLEEIKKELSEDDFASAFLFSEADPMSDELNDWQGLLGQRYSQKKMLEHACKHPWTVAAHFSYEEVFKTLRSRFLHDRGKLEIKDVRKEKRALKKKQSGIRYKNKKIGRLAGLFHRLALQRIELKACWAGMDFYLLPLFEETSRRFKVEMSDLGKYYIAEDVENLLLKNRKLPENEIANRKKCFVGLLKEDEIIFRSGKKAQELFNREMNISNGKMKKISQFKGVVANRGKLVGTVRILGANDAKQAAFLRKNFKKGEILVTQMTQPNIMDIASRAGAIVTDEGGMLSHAAIISRELKIPCIVSTGIATQVLHDGDRVEVDADKGMVIIIGRKKQLK
jgi:phosphohistidine swiveling domain-containing protein